MSLLWLFGGAVAAERVDVNSASSDALQTLPGIGPARAQRIVDERRRGPFKSLDDLHARVRGLGVKSLQRMVAAGLTVRADSVPLANGDAGAGRLGRVERVLPSEPLRR